MRMTLAEFKADYQRETGAVMSRDAWRVLYSQYCEHDAEAVAGGRDDVAPLVEYRPIHIPYGRCPRHPNVTISNGMFDGLCNICEGESDAEMYSDAMREDAEQASIAREWFPTAFDDLPF